MSAAGRFWVSVGVSGIGWVCSIGVLIFWTGRSLEKIEEIERRVTRIERQLDNLPGYHIPGSESLPENPRRPAPIPQNAPEAPQGTIPRVGGSEQAEKISTGSAVQPVAGFPIRAPAARVQRRWPAPRGQRECKPVWWSGSDARARFARLGG